MKVLLTISLAFVATQALSVNRHWSSFKVDHKKIYDSDVEENLRFEIFQSNLKRIQEHNEKYEKGESSYYMGVTQFADMTPEEFKHMLENQIKSMPEIKGTPANIPNIKLPESVDWTKTGAVLEVKNQGMCGSCWAFSTTGAIEGQNFLKNNLSIELSEQELIDCTKLYNNLGCLGGAPMYSFEYVRRLGISSEESYPYIGSDGPKCNRNPNNTVLKIKDSLLIEDATVSTLKNAIATVGPISVPVTADEALQLYKGGIFDEADCSNYLPNHAVLAVGYGSENGTEYWLLKNSWGKLWGEDGYYRLQVDPVICAILNLPMYPVLF